MIGFEGKAIGPEGNGMKWRVFERNRAYPDFAIVTP